MLKKTTTMSALRGGLLAIAISIAGCSATAPGPDQPSAAAMPGQQVMEIMPGLLQGYLPREEQLDSKLFTSG